MSATTGTWQEVMWLSGADFTALASSAAEGSLISGLNDQPVIPALFFLTTRRRAIRLTARGVLSTTGTPTLIFQVRLGTTAGASYLSGTSVGVSPTITCANGVTNVAWLLTLDLVCYTPGLAGSNCVLSGAGSVASGSGFAAPYAYPLEPTTPHTANWQSSIDGGLSQYLQLSATWGTSSPSNSIQCKALILEGLN